MSEATPEPPVSVEVPSKLYVPVIGDPGFVIVAAGAVLSTRRFVTVEELVVFPALSVETARRSKSPSETPVVSQEQEYGDVESVQMSVQVPLPAGER